MPTHPLTPNVISDRNMLWAIHLEPSDTSAHDFLVVSTTPLVHVQVWYEGSATWNEGNILSFVDDFE